MEANVVTRDGAALWTSVDGAGPPVVLCHGGPGLWDYFEDLATLLVSGFTVHRWDQRDCGRSSAGTEPISVRRSLADLDELRDHFGLDRWLVVGHSWGAYLALLYGLLYPERATAVACVAGTGTPTHWRQVGREATKRAEALLSSPAQRHRLDELSGRARSREEEVEFRILSWRPDYVRPEGSAALQAMAESPLAINFAANRSLMADVVFDDAELRARCGRSPVPMRFIHGELDPRPADGSAQLAGWLPPSRLEVVPGAGHLPWVEQPEEFVRCLTEFLTHA